VFVRGLNLDKYFNFWTSRDQKVVKNCNVKLDKTWLVIFSKTQKM
jgi:hypothetical protein